MTNKNGDIERQEEPEPLPSLTVLHLDEELDRDALAQSLRWSFRGMIVEADEWRPLASYIISLIQHRGGKA